MSAIFSLLKRNAGYLFRDLGCFTADGRLMATGGQILLLPSAKTAVTARGFVPLGRWPAELCGLTSLEAVVERLPELAAWLDDRAHASANASEYAPEVRHVEVTAVGWSDAHGEPQTWSCATDPPGASGVIQQLPGYAPRVALRCAPAMGAPFAPLGDGLVAALVSDDGRESLDPRQVGVSVLTAMREQLNQLPNGSAVHVVAGGVDMATVTSDGVSLDRLRTWPDALGEKVQPHPAPTSRTAFPTVAHGVRALSPFPQR